MKQYLAIDIGGTAVKLGIVDETGAVGPKAEESVNFDGYQTPVLATVLKAARAFVETQNIDVNTLEGVGVSATGQDRLSQDIHIWGGSVLQYCYFIDICFTENITQWQCSELYHFLCH